MALPSPASEQAKTDQSSSDESGRLVFVAMLLGDLKKGWFVCINDDSKRNSIYIYMLYIYLSYNTCTVQTCTKHLWQSPQVAT